MRHAIQISLFIGKCSTRTRGGRNVLVGFPPSRLKRSEKLNRTRLTNEQTKKQERKGFDLDVGVQMIDPSFTTLLANPAGQRFCY